MNFDQQLLTEIRDELATVTEKLAIIEGREARRGKILDRLVDDELQRDEMYLFVRKHVIGTGVVALVSTVFAIMWYAFKTYVFSRP
jgi:ABC-type transport system involved in cytochrome bd biosynthesis fused ATPase/permease subunit